MFQLYPSDIFFYFHQTDLFLNINRYFYCEKNNGEEILMIIIVH